MDINVCNQLININNTLIMCLLSDLEEVPREERRFHVHPYLKEREKKGRFHTDFQDLCRLFSKMFAENFHICLESFNILFDLVQPYLLPKKVSRKDLIWPKMKLAIVLEYLASGDLQRHISSCYRISKQHFGKIIDEVCEAIKDVLRDQVPQWSAANVKEIATKYEAKFNIPNCCGALDGKHVMMKAPPNSGSLFYNYKGHFSMVIMAVCDVDSKFTYLDVGAYGSEGDANIFKNSSFGRSILNDELSFPEDKEVGGIKLPFFIAADDAFPLCKRIMKPFAGRGLNNEKRIFNYRLSRARMCIERTFGIIAWRWLCLQKKIFCKPDRAHKIVTACCLLHNFLVTNDNAIYTEDATASQEFNEEFISITSVGGRSSDYAKFIRNTLKDFVNSSSGSISWQNKVAGI